MDRNTEIGVKVNMPLAGGGGGGAKGNFIED